LDDERGISNEHKAKADGDVHPHHVEKVLKGNHPFY
jgi:hypothetical protein